MASSGSQYNGTIRVVLLGKTGAGKSSLGNSLLGPKTFTVGRGLSSETKDCSYQTGHNGNITFEVIDTPGLCDTHRDEAEIYREVGKSVALCSPGPHIILMVLRCDRRFTKEEHGAYETLKLLFSEQMCKHMIIVFNGLDTFKDPEDEDEPELQELRTRFEAEMKEGKASPQLRQVLTEAKGSYFGMNNKAPKVMKDLQIRDLIDRMLRVVSQNENGFYSNELCVNINQRIEQMVRDKMGASQISPQATPKSHAQAMREVKEDVYRGNADPGFFTTIVRNLATAVKASAVKLCALM